MITNADEFVRLRQSDSLVEQRRASHEAASEAVWLDVIKHYPELRKWVAHNKTVPLEIPRQLSSDHDRHVRWNVATKRKLDRALFKQLATDPDEGVRRAIANNAKCPADIRELLVI